jgi:hypothetical protein
MIKKTFNEFMAIVERDKDDPLQQVFNTEYDVEGRIIRTNGNLIQWRTPAQSDFTFGMTFQEFIKQVETGKPE